MDGDGNGKATLCVRALLSDILVHLGLITVAMHLVLLGARVTNWLVHRHRLNLSLLHNAASWLRNRD